MSDHPGVLVRLDAATPAPLELTTVTVNADVGFGNTVFVRGDQVPLSWTEGWPAVNDGPRSWRFASTELTGTFEFKALRNDADWSTGENLVGFAGADTSVTVAFE